MLLTGFGVLVLVLVGGWYWMSSNLASTPAAPDTVVQVPQPQTHALALAKRVLTPNIVTVTQGDQVTIKVMSDESGEFHISGYEIENDMTVGTELSFSFTADKAGRYNFELHPKEDKAAFRWIPIAEASENEEEEGAAEEDIVIGAFVVNPR